MFFYLDKYYDFYYFTSCFKKKLDHCFISIVMVFYCLFIIKVRVMGTGMGT
jgi:hypothetical protein